eukprot:293175-Pyramimonas_sp.AAC.1
MTSGMSPERDARRNFEPQSPLKSPWSHCRAPACNAKSQAGAWGAADIFQDPLLHVSEVSEAAEKRRGRAKRSRIESRESNWRTMPGQARATNERRRGGGLNYPRAKVPLTATASNAWPEPWALSPAAWSRASWPRPSC